MSFKTSGAGFDLAVFKDYKNGFIYQSGVCPRYFTKTELFEMRDLIQKTIDYYEKECLNDKEIESLNAKDTIRNHAIKPSLQKNEVNKDKDHLYVIFDSVNKSLKIGRSKDVLQRLKTLQLSTSNKLELLTVIAKAGEMEKVVHEQFAHKRLASEWFQDCKEIRSYLGII